MEDFLLKAAFQGERGAYSEDAVRMAFGAAAEVVPCASFAVVFDAVEREEVRAALLPIENSQVGSVLDVYDLLMARELVVIGEYLVPVDHCLLALEGQTLEDIREVMSHPQALAQCAAFVEGSGAAPRASHDTAGSARIVATERLRGVAAIASARAGEIYGLGVLARGIQTVPDNFTRFFALVKPGSDLAPASVSDKTSVVFGLPNESGALYRALGAVSTRGLNMTKIESRPSRQTPWEYVFYLDFEGDPAESKVQRALEELRFHARFLKVLG
ncbi:MAG: prephenate dehydratase, partial [Candidatus Sericytochromatia bacterium]|nr:prephenate dehydratase [Candidatus Tanganyikabacteria bacterium]